MSKNRCRILNQQLTAAKAYDLLAKNHKHPQSLADTLDRILGDKLDK